MKVMKIAYILKKALRKKGEVGEVIQVAPGFGRYLEGQNIAQRANKTLLENLEKQKAEWLVLEAENQKKAIALVQQIKGLEVTLKRKTSQNEKLYEAIRPEHIVEACKALGINLERYNVKLDQQIKKTGKHKITIHAYGNHETDITLDVISETE